MSAFRNTLFGLGLATVLASCGGNTEVKKVEVPEVEVKSNLKYDYVSTNIQFGGFKTTDKVEVKGKFDKFTVSNTKEGSTGKEVFEGATIAILTSSVNTNNPDRDKKISTLFFGAMAVTDTIHASVKSIDESNGKITLGLNLNAIEKDLVLAYEQSGDTVRASGTIDLLTFEAQPAVDELNKACFDLHKGADGVSKTWSEANVYIQSVLR
jgi:polyisoprenoid-binding protein YceI